MAKHKMYECQSGASTSCEGKFQKYHCDECVASITDECSYCHEIESHDEAPNIFNSRLDF